MNKNIIIAFGTIVIIVTGLFLISGFRGSVVENISVTTFEECKNAGYPIMESYPAQCRDASGNNFVEIIENPDTIPTPNPTVKPTPSEPCFIGGCSGQICSGQKGMITTCEYKEEYACYKNAKCERQVNGQCGWTQAPALKSCLNPSSTKTIFGYLTGHVTIGPFCPVEKVGEPCEAPESAYTGREALVYGLDKVTVKYRMNLDKSGNYKFTLPIGEYYVQIHPASMRVGEMKYVKITSSTTGTVDFDIDTGIR